MYTLTFQASNVNTVGTPDSPCLSQYVNPMLTSLTSTSNLIQRISNGDITQFLIAPNRIYTAILHGNVPIGRTYTFRELQSIGIMPQDAEYKSGPQLECPDNLSWVLYSVAQKQPVELILVGPLTPPYAVDLQIAVVQLIPRLVGDSIDAYYELYFPILPTSPDGRGEITFTSHSGNTVFATRINGVNLGWEYDVPPDSNEFASKFSNVILIQHMEIVIRVE